MFLLLYDFQDLNVGKLPQNHFQKIKKIIQLMVFQVADSIWDQFQHRSVSSSSRAAANIEANKLLFANHHISRTTATSYTTLPSPSEILGLSISSRRRCPSVQLSHLFDPFETGELASVLASGRPCSGTNPTPKLRHGSAPERVDHELTPSPDLKWAWSATKVHRFVDFRNRVANWKDYGEEMEFSEKDFVKKKNILGLSKKKKNSVLVCLKKKEIGDSRVNRRRKEVVRVMNDLIWGLIEEEIRDLRRGIGDFISRVPFWKRFNARLKKMRATAAKERKQGIDSKPAPKAAFCTLGFGLVGSLFGEPGNTQKWADWAAFAIINSFRFWRFGSSAYLGHYCKLATISVPWQLGHLQLIFHFISFH